MLVSIIVVLVILADVLSGGMFRSVARTGAGALLGATGRAVDSVRESELLTSRAALVEENVTLQERIEALEALQLQNDVLRMENRILRDLVGLAEAYPDGPGARVLSRPSTSAFGTFLIGAGAQDGVREGDYVIAEGAVAVGMVDEVSRNSALAILFTTPGQETAGTLGETPVSVVGRGGGNGIIELPRDVAVSVGEHVILPDTGFILATVGHITAEAADATQQVLVRVPVDIKTLRFARVVSPEPGE